MSLYQLDRSDLNTLLISDNVDPATRKAVIDLLQDDGYFKHNGSVQVQEGGALDPHTQVLIVDTPNANVTADPALKVIVDLAPNLTVTGGSNLFIATPDGTPALPGQGEHNAYGLEYDRDENHGQNTIGGSSGLDTVTGGGGHDTVSGGAGHQQMLFDIGSGGQHVPPEHGVTTINFAGGQSPTINQGVEQLVFTDHPVKH